MSTRKYTDEELRLAVDQSSSVSECLKKLNIRIHSYNYKQFKKRCTILNIDISHFTGKLWRKNKYIPIYNISDYLTNKRTITSYKLKNRLIKDRIFEHKCYQCHLIEWNDQLIPLELHHKDGNRKNNELSNIILLCPNCHAQTSNYRTKNRKSNIKQPKYLCLQCNKTVSKTQRCMECYLQSKRDNIPSKEVLEKLVWEKSLCNIAKDYNTSPPTVAHWCKVRNINRPPIGYWHKNKKEST